MNLPIALGADHAGFELKEALKKHLDRSGIAYHDFGTYGPESVDYPDFAHPVATAVESGTSDKGILICGSGQGVSITANKHAGVRAALCWNPELAALSRQHNNANILSLPARFISQAEAMEITDVFLQTPFEGGRHERRVQKINC